MMPNRQDNVIIDDDSLIFIPIDVMDFYEGVVGSEVVDQGGAVILPAGVDLMMLRPHMAALKKKLKAHRVREIAIRIRPQFSDEDMEQIFERVYSGDNNLIGKEKAQEYVRGVAGLFDSVRQQVFEPEMLPPLAKMGIALSEEIMRNPSVALSLGRVKNADEYTFVHSFNVAVLAGYLANILHPSGTDFVRRVVVGALLHDIGKSMLPMEIINKQGPLTHEEFVQIKEHPRLGLEMAQSASISDIDILDVIYGHHEKISGKGYPRGLAASEISSAARIAAVADVFDALTSKRAYKKAMPSRVALSVILKDAGSHFDNKVARTLLVSLGLYPPGSQVALSDGSVALVVSSGGPDLVRPTLLIRKGHNELIDLRSAEGLHITRFLGHCNKRDIGDTFTESASPPSEHRRGKGNGTGAASTPVLSP